MQNLWNYESMVYWHKNIYWLSQLYQEEQKHPSIIIYTDGEKKARELASAKFKDEFYLNESRAGCDKMSPKEYELLEKKKSYFSDYILINYAGKRIKLKSDQAKKFNC